VKPQELAQAADAPDVPHATLPVGELWRGDRRLEGETYLTGGYRIRRLIEASAARFAPLKDLARTWQPSRLKGILVSREHGEPFFTATQVFDIRPTARKWLAPSRTDGIADRYVEPGWILVTRSGSVGDTILSYAPHLGVIISDDLLRMRVNDEAHLGYLYTFLRTRFGKTMLRSSRYGNIIKHLEPEHLDEIPVPLVDGDIATMLSSRVRKVFQLRDEAFRLVQEAESKYAGELGDTPPREPNEQGYSVSAAKLLERGRRLDGFHHNPIATAVLKALERSGRPLIPLSACTEDVFGVPRFKHVYVESGIPYLDSEDLFKINPELSKFIPEAAKRDAARYYVKRHWLLMACSGQLYGLNGSVLLADSWHENKIVSNHVVRVVPRGVRAGYLQMALGHPVYGRPLVVRLAFGTEVPEISPWDVRDVPVIRLDPRTEDEIADRIERASALRMQADEEENAAIRFTEDVAGSMLPALATYLQKY
jgi:type I restriction enzyme, S subunit